MEPVVTIPLSQYQTLLDKKYQTESPFLIVGRKYEVVENNERNIFMCQSVTDGEYCLVAHPPLKPTIVLKISLKQ